MPGNDKVPEWLDDFVRETMILFLLLMLFIAGILGLVTWLST